MYMKRVTQNYYDTFYSFKLAVLDVTQLITLHLKNFKNIGKHLSSNIYYILYF